MDRVSSSSPKRNKPKQHRSQYFMTQISLFTDAKSPPRAQPKAISPPRLLENQEMSEFPQLLISYTSHSESRAIMNNELLQRRADNDTLKTVKKFLFTVSHFPDLSVVDLSDEIAYVQRLLSKIKNRSEEVESIELAVSDFADKKTFTYNSVAEKEFYLPFAERRFRQGSARLSAKNISQFSKYSFMSYDAQALITSLLIILADFDTQLKPFKTHRELGEYSKKYFNNPGLVSRSIKDIPKNIRSGMVQSATKAKKNMERVKAVSQEDAKKLHQFMQEVFLLADAYAPIFNKSGSSYHKSSKTNLLSKFAHKESEGEKKGMFYINISPEARRTNRKITRHSSKHVFPIEQLIRKRRSASDRGTNENRIYQ